MAERTTARPLLVSAVVYVALLIVVGLLEAGPSPGPQPSRISLPEPSDPEPVDPERSTPALMATTTRAEQNDGDDPGSAASLDPGGSEAEVPTCVDVQGQIADLKDQATDLSQEADEIRVQADVIIAEGGGVSSAAALRDTARDYDEMAHDLRAEANALQVACP
jgi:hypothetical protein